MSFCVKLSWHFDADLMDPTMITEFAYTTSTDKPSNILFYMLRFVREVECKITAEIAASAVMDRDEVIESLKN